jgi:GNAT superfamily N-acetyltransferase
MEACALWQSNFVHRLAFGIYFGDATLHLKKGNRRHILSIRPAVLDDVPLLKTLIHELAEFERDQVFVSEANLLRDGFGPQPKFRALIAEWDSQPAGYALFFDCYASFQGRGLYLEDLFVRPEYRRKSVGRALLARIAAIAQKDNCFGVMFTVMDWNDSAIEFYQKLEATFLDEWKIVCLKRNALATIAGEGRKNDSKCSEGDC